LPFDKARANSESGRNSDAKDIKPNTVYHRYSVLNIKQPNRMFDCF